MMKLFVWLGNPWDKYRLNRHNVGFMMLDEVCRYYSFEAFSLQSKYNALVANGNIWMTKIIAIKPMTYMNLSGDSVSKICQFYKIQPIDILVFQDDIDMDFSKIRLKIWWKAWWHNWIKDIEKKLWTQDFWRLKRGVWRSPNPNITVSDYVLSNFSSSELSVIESKMNEVILKTNEFLTK